jgi:hypothetical protein
LTPQTGFTFSPSQRRHADRHRHKSGSVTFTTNGHNFGSVTVGTTSAVYGVVLTNSTASAVAMTLRQRNVAVRHVHQQLSGITGAEQAATCSLSLRRTVHLHACCGVLG